MSVYLDASVIVALFTVDPLNDRTDKVLRGIRDTLVVSDFAGAEFSAVIARRVRTRDLSAGEARTAFANFDLWCASQTRRVEIEGVDVAHATGLMRRLDAALRMPDALHIAIAQRNGSDLLTFDRAMANVARGIGIEIVKG
ncbi:MAG TPA: type II toxin-antitoxin system VapC family toxin [Xanthobacteraceae bacterium]|nr:type II toxin-antitoxin system VapC family toxin [Xanthobacteraceae bacterium]